MVWSPVSLPEATGAVYQFLWWDFLKPVSALSLWGLQNGCFDTPPLKNPQPQASSVVRIFIKHKASNYGFAQETGSWGFFLFTNMDFLKLTEATVNAHGLFCFRKLSRATRTHLWFASTELRLYQVWPTAGPGDLCWVKSMDVVAPPIQKSWVWTLKPPHKASSIQHLNWLNFWMNGLGVWFGCTDFPAY